jgi:alpha-amylase
MVVRQHELLRRGPGLFTTALGMAMLCTACVAPELEDVENVKIGTHVDDWRDEVIYQLLTDRFANGDARNDHRVDTSSLARYQGGDYQGIIDHLDYLEELGVTTLWISPIVMNVDHDAGFDAYHGYWAVNLERLNPHFGDLATLRRLVNEAHARDMKIVLDLVTNHLGQVFYYDINNNGQPDEWLAGGGETVFTPRQPAAGESFEDWANSQGSSSTHGMPGSSSSAENSGITRVTEYDPEYDRRGVQGFTSLGLSGPAPIRFFDDPAIWRVQPEPAIFQRPEAYNRRGRVSNWDCKLGKLPGVDLDICDQVVLGDFPGGLKDLNTQNPKVREALIDAYVNWVLKTDIDGFRIDTLKHVEHDFWRVWGEQVRTRLKKAGKTNFIMFGEAFDGSDKLVGSYTHKGMMDSVFYFPQRFQVFNDVFRRNGPTANVERLLTARETHYGKEAQAGGIGIAPNRALVNFMDNHDVPRFLFTRGEGYDTPVCIESDNCTQALRAALTYLFTEDGIPCLYYGTEQEFQGGNDPGNREPLWHSKFKTDGETFRHISKVLGIRRTHEALRRGSFKPVWTTEHVGSEEDAGMLAFERATDGDYALVVINTSPTHTSATASGAALMTLGSLPAGVSTLKDELGTLDAVSVPANKQLKITLPPYGAAILVPQR